MFIGYILMSNFIKQNTCHDEWVKHIFKGWMQNGITLLTDPSSHHTQTRHEAQSDLLLFSDLSASRGVFKSFSWATDRGGQCIGTVLVVRLWKVPILLTNISSLSMSGKCALLSSLVLSCCLFELHRACFSEMTSVVATGDGMLLQCSSVPGCATSLVRGSWREWSRQNVLRSNETKGEESFNSAC